MPTRQASFTKGRNTREWCRIRRHSVRSPIDLNTRCDRNWDARCVRCHTTNALRRSANLQWKIQRAPFGSNHDRMRGDSLIPGSQPVRTSRSGWGSSFDPFFQPAAGKDRSRLAQGSGISTGAGNSTWRKRLSNEASVFPGSCCAQNKYLRHFWGREPRDRPSAQFIARLGCPPNMPFLNPGDRATRLAALRQAPFATRAFP